jgi:hypothetical protein
MLTQPSIALNQIASPLLRLPAELCNIIYEYALGGKEVHLGHGRCETREPQKAPKSPIHLSPTYIYRRRPFSLLRVCRQTNAEARYLPFTLNEFWGTTYWFADARRDFLTPERFDCITSVVVQLESQDVLCGSFLGKAVMGRLLKELVGAMARSEVLVKEHFKTATCPWWRSPLEPDWMDELLGDVMGEYEG